MVRGSLSTWQKEWAERLIWFMAVTQYLVHGGDVISPQRKLGHSSLTMTDRNVHLVSDQAAII